MKTNMKTNMKTKTSILALTGVRQRALDWWKSLGDDIGEIADKYYRGCETIQEHQIEEIYNKEHSLFKQKSYSKNCVLYPVIY